MTVLAWALKLIDSPKYDALADMNTLFPEVRFLQEVASDLLSNPQLRTSEELNQYMEQALALHWRLRDYSLNSTPVDFAEFGKTCWFGPISTDWANIIDGDLALEDSPISKASEDIIDRSLSCAVERHLAINWLHGHSNIYSQTDTST